MENTNLLKLKVTPIMAQEVFKLNLRYIKEDRGPKCYAAVSFIFLFQIWKALFLPNLKELTAKTYMDTRL